MAAIATGLMATLEAGDRVLAQPGLYGGTHTLLTDTLPRYDIEVDFLPEGGPEAWEEALQPSTQVLYVEALSNPLLGVADLERLAAFADAHDLVAMVDNTFATPINLRPMEWGFDLVVHSATKYLGGHSDLGAGVVAGRGALMEAVRPALRQFGGMLDPHACFLLHRSLKTLGLRVRQHNANALRLARALAAHDAVDRVYHPGLSAHPHHARAERLLDGFGGMLSLELVPGCDPDAFVDELTLAVQAPSLGGLETLITRPARTSHKDLPPEVRRERGITDRLLRVSVGLEDGRDLEDDFTQALDAVMAQAPA
jgi:cystathionine gamma-synthase/cystathionine gamma-lyase/cystathionine beta-lyase